MSEFNKSEIRSDTTVPELLQAGLAPGSRELGEALTRATELRQQELPQWAQDPELTPEQRQYAQDWFDRGESVWEG